METFLALLGGCVCAVLWGIINGSLRITLHSFRKDRRRRR